MRKTMPSTAFRWFGLLLTLSVASQTYAQDTKTPYPNMAPLDQYLMERNAEINLARSAAPPSISKDAEVMVLGKQGYEIVDHGTNGFVCMVQRSWTAPSDDPDFWNPKLRGPSCFNAAAAKSYLPLILKKTDLILGGRSKSQMFSAIAAAIESKELSGTAPDAMCYMMSKQQYLGDAGKQWHPHLMFFVPPTDAAVWGGNFEGSPVIAANDEADRLTIFMVPVRRWSDGTFDLPEAH